MLSLNTQYKPTYYIVNGQTFAILSEAVRAYQKAKESKTETVVFSRKGMCGRLNNITNVWDTSY